MLLSSLDYGAFLTYSPWGTNDISATSRNWMGYLKRDSIIRNVNIPTSGFIPFSEFIAQSIKNELTNFPFKDFFGSHIYLVPVPGSSLMKEGTLWVPKNLVDVFSKQGLGKPFICLERMETVKKSAFSEPKDRPKASDHFRTIKIKSDLKRIEDIKEIILVDDIVTRGSTLLGAASRLHEAFPNAHIRAFAVIRTMSNPNEFNKIQDPCTGTITLLPNGETHRDP